MFLVSRPVNWKFPKTKVTLLIWRIIISMIVIKIKNKLFYYCDEQKKFSCKLKSNHCFSKAMNKKESWIIDNKYFNCESMTLCLQRKANIRKLICNKKTKELHLDKIKRPILAWLFCGLPSLRLLLFTSFWESCLSWQTKTFVEAFLKLKSVSKYFKKKTKTKKKKKHSYTLFL